MKKRARKAALRKRQAEKTLKVLSKEAGVRRALWILKVPTSFRELKGLVTEEKALRAFEYFQQRKVEFYQTGVITKITPTIHYSEEDRESIDLKVEFQSGEILLAEVKNWWSQQLEEKLRERNRCLIAIPWKTANEEARKIVWEAVNQFFRKQKGKREKERRSTDQLVGAHH